VAAVSFPDDRVRFVAPAVGLVVAVGTALAVGLLAVGGYDSTTETHLRSLHRTLLVVAAPLVLLVEGLLVYAVVRRSPAEPAESGDSRAELAWTVGTAAILLLVGLLSYGAMGQPSVLGGPAPDGPPGEAVTVTVTAERYDWTFAYDDGSVRTNDRLVLPANRTVVLRVTSRDVIHSLSIPGLGIKRDAMPGQYTAVRTTATTTGTYRLYCAEFCGAGHAEMTATVAVVPPGEFDAWLRTHGATAPTTPTPGFGEA